MGIGMLGMMLLWLLIPATLIWLAAGAFRRADHDAAPTALQILEARFARGEIDAEEFTTRRLAIESRAS